MNYYALLEVKHPMEQSACRISVIVPAYNAAFYLERCYQSLLAQSVTDWEMLIVENGSTDDTAAVGERLAQQDSRVWLLHSEKGVSHARNLGIAEARGEYTTFLDADDRLLSNAFEVFLHAAGAHPACEVIVGGTDGVAEGGPDTVYEGARVEEARVLFLRHPTRYLTVWGKLYRTAFLQNSAVRFDPALTHAEDSDYLIRLLADCHGLVLADAAVYRYTVSAESAVHGQAGKLAAKYRASLEATARQLAEESAAIREAFHFYVLDNLLVLLVHDTFCSAKSARAQRQDATAVLDTPIFRHALACAPLGQAPLVKRLAYTAAKRKCLRLLQLIIRVRQWQNRRRQAQSKENAL